MGNVALALIQKALLLVSMPEMKKTSKLDICRYFIHIFYLRVLYESGRFCLMY